MHKIVLGVVTAACLLGRVGPAQAVTLDVHGTFDLTDSGIYGDVIKPGFEAASPGDTINYTPEGSGTALNNARVAGNTIDVVLVHAPTSERTFVDAGASAEPLGRALFYNDYVIVGPLSDPAGVKASFAHDAVGAYQAIAARGASASADATFLTRDDISGTNTAEQVIWGQTTGVPSFQVAAGPPRRLVPSTSTTMRANPPWYKTGSGNGQAANLDATSDCTATVAPQGGCYTMVDRGTYYRELAAGRIPNLQIVTQENAPTAVGGASELTNPFHGYLVNTSKQKQAAKRLLDYLQSPAFQASLAGYPGNGLQAVFPSATPQLTASTIPTSADRGGPVAISATLTYAPPVAQPIASLPVQLQSSPSGQPGSFSDVGAPVSTGADGTVRLAATAGQGTTFYRLTTPSFLDNPSQSLFAPGTITGLGTQGGRVDVEAAPATPPATTTITTTTPAAPPPAETVTVPGTPAPSPVSNVLAVGSISGAASGLVTLRLGLPGRGTAVVGASARIGGRKVTFGKGTTISAPAATTRTVRVQPSRAARRALRGSRRLSVTLTLRFTPTGGTARTSTATVSVG